ncbi:MAG: flagella basal body P-ring formation protein FlgA [Alphaproteobacteria bacterium]|nr:flagella basal body P-ring formation protein FlgA [Alphaproteobacteria bacterium]
MTDATQLVGQELRRNLAEGQALRLRDVAMPRLVKRGQMVTMRIASPIMSMTARGVAQSDGSAGDLLRLQNTQSKRVVQGVVQPDGTVVVDMPMPALAQQRPSTVIR